MISINNVGNILYWDMVEGHPSGMGGLIYDTHIKIMLNNDKPCVEYFNQLINKIYEADNKTRES